MKKFRGIVLAMVFVLTAIGFGSVVSADRIKQTDETFSNANVGTVEVQAITDSGYGQISAWVINGYKDATTTVVLQKSVSGVWSNVGTISRPTIADSAYAFDFNVGAPTNTTWRFQVKQYSSASGALVLNVYTKSFVY
jgi:hypothetical protein